MSLLTLVLLALAEGRSFFHLTEMGHVNLFLEFTIDLKFKR